jgi:glycosyltransferase involved in cell wall biosynthesis
MGRIRVLHVITGLGTGGAERMLCKLVCTSDKSRFEMEVVSLTDRGTQGALIEDAGVPVHVLNMRQGRGSLRALLSLAARIRAQRFHILMGWMYHSNLAVLAGGFLAGTGTPVLWNIRHTPHDLWREKALTRWLIRLGAQISGAPKSIVYNSVVSRRRHEELGYRGSHAVVIPNGFDTDMFSPSPAAKAPFRSELGIPEGGFVFGHVARFHPMKDHRGFLCAAQVIATRIPHAWFVLAGSNVTLENQELASWLDESGIKSRVRVLGERCDMPHLLSTFDVLCLSSAWGEGFSNTIGEAMACGVPCVTTNVGDSGDLVNGIGKVVAPGDCYAFANACCTLAALSSREREALGKAARARILAKYSLATVVTRYESLYESTQALH